MRTPAGTKIITKNKDTKIRTDHDSKTNKHPTKSIETKNTQSTNNRNIKFMDKQKVTTEKYPYTRNNHTSNNQYNNNKDQQINKSTHTNNKYNDKQSDKKRNYWHSINKQKLIPISKIHTLFEKQSKQKQQTQSREIHRKQIPYQYPMYYKK